MKVIFKTHYFCNLDCDYCYLGNKTAYKGKQLTLENAKTIISKWVEYVKKQKTKKLTIVWHGGEPLLFDREFYEKIFIYIKKLEYTNDVNIINSIQTNLVVDISKFIDLFVHFNISIGTSLDGFNASLNIQRFGKKSDKKFQLFVKNLKLLKKNKVNIGFITVVTSKNYNHMNKLYKFAKEQNVNFSISPMSEDGSAISNHLSFNSNYYYLAFKQLFHAWMNDEDRDKYIPKTISEMFGNVIGLTPRLCTFQNDCQGKFIGINWKGMVYSCSKFEQEENYEIGNIFENDLGTILNKEYKHITEYYETPKKCLNCEFLNICNGGCPYERYLNHEKHDIHCEAYFKIFTFLKKQKPPIFNIRKYPKKSRIFIDNLKARNENLLILAPGYSLDYFNISDFPFLDKIDVLTINSSTIYDKLNPDYCLSLDDINIDDISDYNIQFITSTYNYPKAIDKISYIKPLKGLGFSKNISNGIFLCGNSVYASLQIAKKLNYKKIFIVGLDLNVSDSGQIYSCNYIKKAPDFNEEARIQKLYREFIGFKFLCDIEKDWTRKKVYKFDSIMNNFISLNEWVKSYKPKRDVAIPQVLV